MRIDRRQLLQFSAGGLFSVALADLLRQPANATSSPDSFGPHVEPKAKRVVHICLMGGLSHVDSFDFKPELRDLNEKPVPSSIKPDSFFGSAGLMRKNEWSFRRRGQSGLWVSELFPCLAEIADELTVINSMHSESANHTPATFLQNSGFQTNGFPSLGSWLSYGLGNESESLPTFVVLPDARSLPNNGASNWSNGFLPAIHQGTLFGNGPVPIRNLDKPVGITETSENASRKLLRKLNENHLKEHPDEDLLKARIRAYEIAAKMQSAVPETTDLNSEPESIRRLYGLDDQVTFDGGRRCLLARKLLESGVRYVQIFSGGAFGGKPRHGWDGHENNRINHTREAKLIDRPVAALIKDLRQRGLLDDTLVLFTTEFGRTPFTQAPSGKLGLGRDHNPEGFTVWMAGAGLKSGMSYGSTDEVGWKAIENRVAWPDFHATVLHLLGLDHKKLTFYHNGIDRRLTNVHGHVIRDILE